MFLTSVHRNGSATELQTQRSDDSHLADYEAPFTEGVNGSVLGSEYGGSCATPWYELQAPLLSAKETVAELMYLPSRSRSAQELDGAHKQ